MMTESDLSSTNRVVLVASKTTGTTFVGKCWTKGSVAPNPTSVMTEIYTTDKDIQIAPQWIQIFYPEIHESAINITEHSIADNWTISLGSTVRTNYSPLLGNTPICVVGDRNLHILTPNPNVLMMQSGTNFYPPPNQ
jgi:hypothetical protein